jgi:DNA-binding SARP family transcriptional activator
MVTEDPGEPFFGVLGPLLIIDPQGMEISIQQAKQRILMAAMLLNRNATVSSAQLAHAVWEEGSPPNAMAVIRTYVARLRRTLGPMGSLLVSRPGGYALEIRGAGQLDLIVLEQLRQELREASEARQWAQVVSVSQRALSLWRGTPLEDIQSDHLCLPVVEWLHELRLQLIGLRIDAELSLGRHRHVVAELRELATVHPFHEHFHSQLMLAYYRCGQQVAALNIFHQVRHSLLVELGIEPGPELRDLHQRILSADPMPM